MSSDGLPKSPKPSDLPRGQVTPLVLTLLEIGLGRRSAQGKELVDPSGLPPGAREDLSGLPPGTRERLSLTTGCTDVLDAEKLKEGMAGSGMKGLQHALTETRPCPRSRHSISIPPLSPVEPLLDATVPLPH